MGKKRDSRGERMKGVSIRIKVLSIVVIPLIVVGLVLGIIFISLVSHNQEDRINAFRLDLLTSKKEKLKSIVEWSYRQLESISKDKRFKTVEEAQAFAKSLIQHSRYDGTGYVWINDTTRPVPKMVMHPTVPALNGKILDDKKYNCALGKKENLFVAMNEESSKSPKGEAFVDYMWPKPTREGLTEDQPKISFVKRFETWNWIIGTGVYINDVEEKVAVEQEKVDGQIQSSLNTVILLMVISIVAVIVVISLFVRRYINKPLSALINFIKSVEEVGDFSVRNTVVSQDEIGKTSESFNSLLKSFKNSIDEINEVMTGVSRGDFTRSLKEDKKGDLNELNIIINNSNKLLSKTIEQCKIGSDQVSVSSNELSSSAQSMASGATEQAASIQQITSTIDQIGAGAKSNGENAAQAQVISNQTIEEVDAGNKQMETMQASMREISKTSENVAKVIKVIDEIAFQTNLLALNAAVEAARAGKYGKGFAVVAEEVRSLASRSSEAAKDTNELIERSIREVDNGVKNADLTAKVLEGISSSVEKVNDLVGEISSASKEQSGALQEISSSVNQMNDVVQQNSSIAEETASASEELSRQSDQLRDLLGKFVLAIDLDGNGVSSESSVRH